MGGGRTRFSGKNVVITGAAGGIGRATLRMFADEGATVVALDRDAQLAAEAALDATRPAGAVGHGLAIDVASSASVERTMGEVVAKVGRIDVLVNAAGVTSRVDFFDMTEAEWDRVMDINLKGTFLVGQYCARLMRDQRAGAIVNVASVAAEVIRREGFGVYPASKAGVQALTKAMAAALGRYDVRVNAVGPGPIRTGMTADRRATPGGEASLLNAVIRRRLGQPDDVANAILFLASDEADFVTGTTLFVDGGILVGTAIENG
jgi:NAD(P)-dependent dehydrogenase (short-subunit alcohol dehydrogenase family)